MNLPSPALVLAAAIAFASQLGCSRQPANAGERSGNFAYGAQGGAFGQRPGHDRAGATIAASTATLSGEGADCSAGTCPATVLATPGSAGEAPSSLYRLTANGAPLFVEELTQPSLGMPVHYAHCALSGAGAAAFSVTVNASFDVYTLSSTSGDIATTKRDNTLSFSTRPNYLTLQVDSQQLLFILVDAEPSDPRRLQVDSKELLFILIDAARSNRPHPGHPRAQSSADSALNDPARTLAAADGSAMQAARPRIRLLLPAQDPTSDPRQLERSSMF